MNKSVITFLLAMIPSIVSIFLLVKFFPYTGLARVVSIPTTLLVNIIILLISRHISQKIKSSVFKSLIWIAAILVSVFVAIVLHPQEYLPSVLTQLRELILSNTTE